MCVKYYYVVLGLTVIDAVDNPGHTLCYCDLERDDIVTCVGRRIVLSVSYECS